MKRIYYLILLLSLFVNHLLIAQNQGFSCGVKDDNLPEKTLKAMRMAPVWLAEKKSRKAANELYVCRIGIDIDSETYTYFDKDTARIKYEVIKTIERVSKIYEAEINTQLVVTHINIWKDPKTDPYYSITDIFELLYKTQTLWKPNLFTDFPFDKVMYLPTKYFSGAGGVAGGNANVSPWGNVSVIAHELGHNFGSPHTQSCSWPGGAIDFCYPAEGDCYQNSLDIIRGTIMSYCNSSQMTFHPLCQALMIYNAERSLGKLKRIETPPVLTDTIIHDGNPFILFDAVVSAESYYFEIAKSADFKEILFADSSQVNAVPYTLFKGNMNYFVRVKAKNRFGTSNWSNTATISIPSDGLPAPVLRTPETSISNNGNLFVSPNSRHILPFEPVEGATNYEIALYPFFDNARLVVRASWAIIEQNATYGIVPRTIENYFFFWRVRALNGDRKGAWSELQKLNLSHNESSIHLPFNSPDNSNMPLNFPITYLGNMQLYDVKFTISANADFSNPVTEKTVKSTKFSDLSLYDFSIMSGDLAPDTQYYLKVETIPPKPDISYGSFSPVFETITKSFRTGSKAIPDNWRFFKQDNTRNLSRGLTAPIVGDKSIYLSSDEGISRINIDSLSVENYNSETTKGQISNFSQRVSADSVGNLWTIAQVSKRSGGYDGLFPKPVYMLWQFDKKTMSLVSSQDFEMNSEISVIQTFDANEQLVANHRFVGRIEGGIIKPLITIDGQFFIYEVINSKSFIWIKGTNSDGRYELKRYNKTTKEIVDFNHYNVNAIKIDKSENLWATFSDLPGIRKYDGLNWTTYNLGNSVSNKYNYKISIDKYDNVYVVNESGGKIYKFDGKEWKTIDDLAGLTISDFVVDEYGKLWINLVRNNLLRIDPCKQISKPGIVSSSATITPEKPILLEARGCSSVIWNWEGIEENVSDKLVLGSNKIEVTPKIKTTYNARCFDGGCSGDGGSFTINYNHISAKQVNKNQICQGDPVIISPEIEGTFDTKNQFSALLTSSQNSFKIDLEKINEDFRFKTDNSLPLGKYWLKLTSSSPEIISSDSIEIEILSLPTVSIVGKTNICFGEGTNIYAAAKNGAPPYIYNWTKGGFATSGSDSVIRGIDVPTVFSVQVKDSKGCVSDISTHTITKTNFNNFKISTSGSTSLIDNASVTLSVPLVATYTYQWFKDNQAIQGAVNNSHSTKQAGQYHVKAYEKGCETKSDGVTVSVITASEPDETNNLNLQVFPNPSDGNFAFEFTLTDNKPAELSIFDISGKRIWLKNSKGRGKHSEQINLSQYPTGTYLLVLQTAQLKRSIKIEKQ